MEKVDYHELVANILKQYSDIFVGEGTEVQLITDRTNGHYLVMFVGWRDDSQVYGRIIKEGLAKHP